MLRSICLALVLSLHLCSPSPEVFLQYLRLQGNHWRQLSTEQMHLMMMMLMMMSIMKAAIHRANAPRTQLRLAAAFFPLKVEQALLVQALLVQALPPQPNRLISRLDTFPKASLSVSLKQCSAGKGGVPCLLAQHWQVLREMRGPCRDDVEGVVDHQAATPLLGHPHRARVLLPQLCDRLRRDQVGR